MLMMGMAATANSQFRGKEAPMDLDGPESSWSEGSGGPSSAAAGDGQSLPSGLPSKDSTFRPATPTTHPSSPATPTNSARRDTRAAILNHRIRKTPLRLNKQHLFARKSRSSLDSTGKTPKTPTQPGLLQQHQHPSFATAIAPSFFSSTFLYLPYTIMGYVQLLFNIFLVGTVVFFLYQFFTTIQRDVDIKVEEHLSGIMGEISHCSKQYVENRCSPELRVPAVEKACAAWEICMKRDPAVIGRAKVSAETFAEIINGFIEPISYKTMIFILLALFGTIFLSNYAFSLARTRAYYNMAHQAPPPTPSAHPSSFYSHHSPAVFYASPLSTTRGQSPPPHQSPHHHQHQQLVPYGSPVRHHRHSPFVS